MSDFAEIMEKQKSKPIVKPILDALDVERLFCLAILLEGTDVTARVLKRYTSYRENPDEILAELGVIEKKMADGEG